MEPYGSPWGQALAFHSSHSSAFERSGRYSCEKAKTTSLGCRPIQGERYREGSKKKQRTSGVFWAIGTIAFKATAVADMPLNMSSVSSDQSTFQGFTLG